MSDEAFAAATALYVFRPPNAPVGVTGAPFALESTKGGTFTQTDLKGTPSLVFFGYGLGRFGRMSATMAFALGVLVYALQMAASRWWLARYRFGPLEWLWVASLRSQSRRQ